MPETIDSERASAFARHLLGIYTGSVITKLIDIGTRTGLLAALAQGPGTSAELAERAGLNERYVREWLGAMATAGICEYEAAGAHFSLPAEHAAILTGDTARNLAPMAQIAESFGKLLPDVASCFRTGGGVPYSSFRPEFTERMADVWRRIFDEHLLSGFLPVAPEMVRRLEQGCRVADIGCGTGHTTNLMARAYPASDFIGYDLAADAIGRADAERLSMGLRNVRFEVRDVTKLPDHPKFDVVTAFDAIHDQVDPARVLRRVRQALATGGVFFMVDFKFSSRLEKNIGNPFAPFYYGISLMHCMTVSLAEGGAGLGAVWGVELARQMVAEAGFSSVDVHDCPRPQNCIFVCRPAVSEQPRA
jgi:SAM-dependent methyltransferase